MRELIDQRLDPAELTPAQQDMIRQRAAELDADPGMGITWEDLDRSLQEVWG